MNDEFNSSPINLLKSNLRNLAQGFWDWILIFCLKKCMHIPCFEHDLSHIMEASRNEETGVFGHSWKFKRKLRTQFSVQCLW